MNGEQGGWPAAHTLRPAHDGTGPRPPGAVRPDPETAPLLSAVDPQGSERRGDHETLLARVVWSRVTEPGDATAGALVAALGPLLALDLLTSRDPARAFAGTLRDRGGSGRAGEAGTVGPDPDALSPRRLRAGVKRWLPRLSRADSFKDLSTAAALQLRVVTPESHIWPAQLNGLGPHSPHALWVRGDPRAVAPPSLAVVGARASTTYGGQVTMDLAGEACDAGFTIVSGAAYGIDAVAHRTALAAGTPTVAVLAGGVDRPYPAAHDRLLSHVADQGAVCAELPPGAAPTRWRFLQRNRIIAALSRGVLVTEAGVRSGTLNTAGHAAELGRALGAVPGPITSPASAGCHRLVREYGAMLVTTRAEVRELLGAPDAAASAGFETASPADAEGAQPVHDDPPPPAGAAWREPPFHSRVLDALPLSGSRSSSDVARAAGLSQEETRDALAELELLGRVARTPSGDGGPLLWRLERRSRFG
ncbi:DNA-processing protein DprA [Leucobacter aridicollis]|uniref:DNA processing protein n=1 Tax=Leucobacter aridicollis TaxID=283878 RepID=A0A852R0R1_9MICO|nr:DNA-processing protein DprA [Leucobacter aridicollis]MBL3681780.1 DNA-protecting protein DprA [Leucobacter aridicollis]NYD27181.1 DNA processing protein [Leucobacter aridicollis]